MGLYVPGNSLCCFFDSFKKGRKSEERESVVLCCVVLCCVVLCCVVLLFYCVMSSFVDFSAEEVIAWAKKNPLLSARDVVLLQQAGVDGQWLSSISLLSAKAIGLSSSVAYVIMWQVGMEEGREESEGEGEVEEKRGGRKELVGSTVQAQTAFFSTSEMELDIEPGDNITVLEQVFFFFLSPFSSFPSPFFFLLFLSQN